MNWSSFGAQKNRPGKFVESVVLHCLILLEFGMLVHYGSAEAVEWLQSKMAVGTQIVL